MARACLIKLPEGERVPMAVARITVISELMLREGVEAVEAWRALSIRRRGSSSSRRRPWCISRDLERPFLHALAGDRPLPL